MDIDDSITTTRRAVCGISLPKSAQDTKDITSAIPSPRISLIYSFMFSSELRDVAALNFYIKNLVLQSFKISN